MCPELRRIRRNLLQIENKNVKVALCRDFRIELAQGAGRRIAGICKSLKSFQILRFV